MPHLVVQIAHFDLAAPRSLLLECGMVGARFAAWSVAVFAVLATASTAASESAVSANARDGDEPAAEGPRPELGPKTIDLGDELVLDLPAGMGYFDRAAARALMEKMGNEVDDSLRGLVVRRDASWLIELEYVGDGHVRDDDAADLKSDEILKSIRVSTEEGNAFRKQRGFPALHVEGWTEPPRYDRAAHHLVWGIKGKHDDGTPASVNFYTRVLGRRGFVALNLMDDPESIEASKADGLVVLAATRFKPGARYADFDARSDKVAAYGLAALVLGGAGVAALKIAKVGLLAKLGGKVVLLFLAAKKVVVLFLVGVVAWWRRVFGARKAADAASQKR
jgi:uncharacterized membrane-anchored protein